MELKLAELILLFTALLTTIFLAFLTSLTTPTPQPVWRSPLGDDSFLRCLPRLLPSLLLGSSDAMPWVLCSSQSIYCYGFLN